MATVVTDIKVDYDERMTRSQLIRFIEPRLTFLFRFIFPAIGRLKLETVRVARTRHGWHVLIIVENSIPNKELILIQSCLGSDFRRELGNLERAASMRGSSWNRLYSEKVDEIRIRRKRKFFRLRKFLRLNPYELKETGRFKTVGREIPDPELGRKLRAIILSAQRKPTFN